MRCPRRSCGRCFKPYAVAAGVPGIAPHDTRRSCAKFRREAGADLRMVRTWAVLRLVQLALLAAPERPGAGGASATRPDTTLPVRRDFAGRGIVRAGFAR
jgi:hypothetical protein